jgi:pyrroline-5-carboxylate reductase
MRFGVLPGATVNPEVDKRMVIGFIGAGVMARALARGLVEAHVVPASDLICSAPSQSDGQPFLEAFPGARWTADNVEVLRASDLTILAIKPQVFPEAMSALQPSSAGKLVLSIAAAITLAKIAGWLHPTARIVRAMPNTPMQIGLGASVYAGGPGVSEEDYALVHRVLASSGRAWRVEETQIDAVTALSGSGPAYVFHFIDALLRGGMALDLPEELARDLAVQTVLGSAQLAAQSSLAPLDLAAQVKSPRGTTLAGCAVLEENSALNLLMARCLAAAKNRAEALARGEA